MLDWLGDEGVRLASAFQEVFGERCRPFGSASKKRGGVSDGNEGVQWNAGIDPTDGVRWVGVNLEGMKYDGWPIARLITRELKQPTLAGLVRALDHSGLIKAWWQRDYWQAASRPPIREGDIAPTPIRLDHLTDSAWREVLTAALGCLDADRGYNGRATRSVTLDVSGQRIEKAPVSPHLTFMYPTEQPVPWGSFLREGKARMQALYDWTAEISAPRR